MNWNNVKLVCFREVRDQLRDRRTMFMIFVLPILLYPFLGMSFFQVAQFIHEHPTRILFVGRDRLPDKPALFSKDGSEDGSFAYFHRSLFSDAASVELLEVYEEPAIEAIEDPVEQHRAAEEMVKAGLYEVAVFVPPDFGGRLAEFREHLADGTPEAESPGAIPRPIIDHHGAKEKSQIAFVRVALVMERWSESIGRENLESVGISEQAIRPFETESQDVAQPGHRDAHIWSKIFPFMLLIWALTGAFYPAVDLCAGEKERGTLETLLSSPAERSEIVWGKLLTVMLFSMATVVLNLVSVLVTGILILSHVEGIGPPPVAAFFWMLLALIPVSALFSAVCLALAAFARSTKEGQYYLVPAFLITLPLVLIPMAPGTELTLGNSLIPITGMVLLLRSVIEGELIAALPYFPPVAAVTSCCCLLAVRWAEDQFNSESVLFRESERLDLGLWLRRVHLDREDTPSIAHAVFCGMTILMIGFIMSLTLAGHAHSFLSIAAVTQLVVVLTPALLMTVMLTRSPRKTLLLKLPSFKSAAVAVLLAVALHPLVNVLKLGVMHLYPLSPDAMEQVARLFGDTPLWHVLLAVAVLAPICEEIAFRGFILSGLRHVGHPWRAIALSSLFFAMTHTLLQQSLIAFVVGLVIGCLAVRSGSLLPGILYHVVHNSLAVGVPFLVEDGLLPTWLVHKLSDHGDYAFSIATLPAFAIAAWLLLVWLSREPFARSAEETLQEAIDHQSPQVMA